MKLLWSFLFLSCLCLGFLGHGHSEKPEVVKIGSIFSFNSVIGKVAKIAIEEAVKDVNSNPDILVGTRLQVSMQNSNCSGFMGMVEALRFMEKDIVGIIGPQCSVVAHMISHMANELRVPLLSFAVTDPVMSPLQFPYFIRTSQSDLYQMEAIASIVDLYGWKEVIAVFVDDDYGRNGVAALNDKLASRRLRITYKAGLHPDNAVNKNEIMNMLIKIMLLQPRIIVIHVYSELGFAVFKEAKYLGMMGNGYVWIATDWLSTTLDSSSPLPSERLESIQGALVLRPHTPDSKLKREFFARWRKNPDAPLALHTYGLYAYDSVMLLARALDKYFKHGGKVSFSNDSMLDALGKSGSLNLEAMTVFDGGEALLKDILGTHMVGLTGQLQFTTDRSRIRPAYDIINVAGTGVRQIGYWSNHSGLSVLPPESLTKPNMSASQKLRHVIWPGEAFQKPRGWAFSNNGKELKIGVPRRVSYKEFVSQIRGTDNMFKGFCIDVFTAAVNLLPYAVPVKFIPYGNGKENPSYTHMVEMITSGNFDGVVGDIAIVTNRTKIVDFTQPYAASGLVVVAPFKKLNSGAWAFLRPFNRLMWAVTACCFLFVGIVVWILEHRINDEFRGPPKRQCVTILWFSFSTMFFAHRENTVSTLGRLVLIIWLFVVLIINSSYTASLTSILTVQQLSSPIKGIDSLREMDDRIGYQVGSFAERYLRDELNISESRLVPLGSPEAYAKALKDGPRKGGVAAIVDERPYVELFLSSNCAYRIVGQEFTKSGWGFAFPRDSPLAIDLSTAILEWAPAKFEARPFLVYLFAVDAKELEFGRNMVDLSDLIQESVEKMSYEGARVRQWDMSWGLSGKAKGGELVLKLGFQIMEKDGGAGIYGKQGELGIKPSSKPKNFSGSFGRKQSKTSFSVPSPKMTSQSQTWTPASGVEAASDLQRIEHLNLDDPEEKPAPKTEEPEQRVEEDDQEPPDFEVVDKGVEFDDDMETEKSDGTIGERSSEMKEQLVNVDDPRHMIRLTELDSIAKQIKALESMMKDDRNGEEGERESPRLDEEEQTVTKEFLQLLEDEESENLKFYQHKMEISELRSGESVEEESENYLSDLGKGIGCVVQTRDGGYLVSMNPFDTVVMRKDTPKLVMQISKQIVVLPEAGSATGFELFHRMAGSGKELDSKICSLMAMDELMGKTGEQVAFEGIASAIIQGRNKERANTSAARTVAAVKTMANAMNSGRRDRIMTGIWNVEENPLASAEEVLAVSLQKLEEMVIEGLKIQADMVEDDAPFEVSAAKGQPNPLESTIPLDEWLKENRKQKALTVFATVQLRDPTRRYEAVGGTVVVAVQAEDQEDGLKVGSLHVGGVKSNGAEKRRLTAAQWLVEYGMGKKGKKKSNVKRKEKEEEEDEELLWSLSSRVMADMWLKSIRNPDVKLHC